MKEYLAVVGNNSRRIYDVETRRGNESETDLIENSKLVIGVDNRVISHYESITRKEAKKYRKLLEKKDKCKLTQKLREINHELIFPCKSVGII